jgi:trehalose-6-phosphate synthase
MSLDERRARWQNMMDVLLRHSIHAWFSDFMQALKMTRAGVFTPVAKLPPRTAAEERTAVAHP